MKKIIALVVALMFLLPSLALATEITATAPANEEVIKDTTELAGNESVADEPVEENPYTLTIFGYTIVIIPANPEIEGDTTTLGFFKAGEDGETEEEIAHYNVGNILGKAVCTIAKAVDSGPEHGKTVSTFVKKCVEERRVEHKAQMEQKKEELRTKLQEKKEEKLQNMQEKKEEIKERANKHIKNEINGNKKGANNGDNGGQENDTTEN